MVNIAGTAALRFTFDTYYNAVASKIELAIFLTNKVNDSVIRNVNSLEQKKRKFAPKQDDKNRKRKPFVAQDKDRSPTEWVACSPR